MAARTRIGAAERYLEEYRKAPNETRWQQMVAELNAFTDLQADLSTVINDFEHARSSDKPLSDWPKGTRTWMK